MTAKDKRVKVVILSENRVYPNDVRVAPHAQCLNANGYDVTVISPRAKGYARHEIMDGVKVYRFPFFPAKKAMMGYLFEYLTAAFSLTLLTLWVWLRHGLDILLVYNPPDLAFVAGLLPKIMGKTVVFDVRDISPELYQAKFKRPNKLVLKILFWMERASCRISDHIITVNESYRRILQERSGVLDERITVVRQGPDLDLVRPIKTDAYLREKAGTIIAYLGNMSVQDGVEHLLYALRELDSRWNRHDWYCALIGGADDPESLNRLANELGIADRVWLAGYLSLDQWVPLLSTADICVEPAPANTLNTISTMNKIMDYMALGKPSVVYDLPEHRVTADASALYATPDEPTDLARWIAYLMDHPEERQRLGAIGAARVETELALSHQSKRLVETFSRLSNRGNGHKGDA